MTNHKKMSLDPEQRAMADKITEALLEMPEHYRAPLLVFLEKVLDGDESAAKLSKDYNADKMTTVELWEVLKIRYGRADELIA